MAETQMKNAVETPKGEEEISAAGLPLTIHAQYLRDFSFENPNAPDALRGNLGAPEMDIKIGMDARKLPDSGEMKDLYEVVLNIRAEATRKGGGVVFIAELQYGITAGLTGVPEDQVHPLLFIEVPRMAFPFARQILGDITVRGGYPPLLLQPVDFYALYMQRFAEEMKTKDAPSD